MYQWELGLIVSQRHAETRDREVSMLCKPDNCENYSKATKYKRKCYYGPQCWKGIIDQLLTVLKLRVLSSEINENARKDEI